MDTVGAQWELPASVSLRSRDGRDGDGSHGLPLPGRPWSRARTRSIRRRSGRRPLRGDRPFTASRGSRAAVFRTIVRLSNRRARSRSRPLREVRVAAGMAADRSDSRLPGQCRFRARRRLSGTRHSFRGHHRVRRERVGGRDPSERLLGGPHVAVSRVLELGRRPPGRGDPAEELLLDVADITRFGAGGRPWLRIRPWPTSWPSFRPTCAPLSLRHRCYRRIQTG